METDSSVYFYYWHHFTLTKTDVDLNWELIFNSTPALESKHSYLQLGVELSF